MKKYYRYYPLELKKEAYAKDIINEETTIRLYDYDFQKRNDFGFIWLYERYLYENITKKNLFDSINFICYECFGRYYDLLTDQELTLIDRTKNNKREKYKIYIDKNKLEEISITYVIQQIKKIPKREIKNYRDFLHYEIKTKYSYENNHFIKAIDNLQKNQILENRLCKKLRKRKK